MSEISVDSESGAEESADRFAADVQQNNVDEVESILSVTMDLAVILLGNLIESIDSEYLFLLR